MIPIHLLNSDFFGSRGLKYIEITGAFWRCLSISSCTGLYPFLWGLLNNVDSIARCGHCVWAIASLLFWQLFWPPYWLEGIWGCLLQVWSSTCLKTHGKELKNIEDHYLRSLFLGCDKQILQDDIRWGCSSKHSNFDVTRIVVNHRSSLFSSQKVLVAVDIWEMVLELEVLDVAPGADEIPVFSNTWPPYRVLGSLKAHPDGLNEAYSESLGEELVG